MSAPNKQKMAQCVRKYNPLSQTCNLLRLVLDFIVLGDCTSAIQIPIPPTRQSITGYLSIKFISVPFNFPNMLADKTATTDPELLKRLESCSYERYLDAKVEKDRHCEEHANYVRECRRKQQMNAYLSQKIFNGLRPTSNQSFEQVPDDPKPSADKENTPKSHRKRKNEHPLKVEYCSAVSSRQTIFK